ncbi:MAG: FapA family protein, partial [bacterium]|nr:FapA family protein [bacterium]
LVAKAIRNVESEVRGDIVVEQGIIDSNVKCGGNIKIITSKGIISGGNILALKSIYTSHLGSPYGTKTIVIVGKEPWKSEELNKLMAEKEDIKKKLEEVNTNIKYIAGYGREDNLPEAKRIQLNKLREIQRLLIEQLNLRDVRIKELRDEILYLVKEARVQVTGKVYPGVRVWIGSESYTVDDELERIYFIYNEGRVELRAI